MHCPLFLGDAWGSSLGNGSGRVGRRCGGADRGNRAGGVGAAGQSGAVAHEGGEQLPGRMLMRRLIVIVLALVWWLSWTSIAQAEVCQAFVLNCGRASHEGQHQRDGLLSVAAPWFAAAQNGGISGTVTDDTGAVLPGVTVEALGVAPTGPRAAVTDRNGSYARSRRCPPAVTPSPLPCPASSA